MKFFLFFFNIFLMNLGMLVVQWLHTYQKIVIFLIHWCVYEKAKKNSEENNICKEKFNDNFGKLFHDIITNFTL